MIDHMQLATFRQSLPESQRYEIHRFFVVRWDVVKARFLTRDGRKPHTLNVAKFAKAYGLHSPQTVDSPIHIDTTLAMSAAIDPDIPVIVALIAREQEGAKPTPHLLDGYSRLYKAYREERIDIPCYALTPEEEPACRIL